MTIPASKLGAKPSASGSTNSAALTKAFASIDDGSVITCRPETYQLSDFVRVSRSDVTVQGVPGTAFEYTSSYVGGAVEGGQAFLVGTIAEASVPQLSNVTFRGFAMRDLNKVDLPSEGNVGHQPSSIEAFGCENFILDAITFDGSRGNGAFNFAGRGPNNFTPVTQRLTIQNCRIIGAHQGDGFNTGVVAHVDFLNNEMPFGGVRRHFYEGGPAQRSVTMQGNRVNMNGVGLACWASITLLESADVSDNWFMNWSTNGAAFGVAPDAPSWTGGDVLPVRGLSVRSNLFSSRSGLAAVQILVPDVYDHEYTANLFDCMLPVYVASPNKGKVTIRGNTARADCTRPIAAAAGVVLDTDWPVAA